MCSDRGLDLSEIESSISHGPGNICPHLGDIAGPCEHERHRSDRLWHHVQRDLITRVSDTLSGVMRVPVVVSLTDVHEGGVVAECQEPQPDTMEDVDHARLAGVLTEGDHPAPAGVAHRLVVHAAHVLLQHGVQQVHVVGLGLDRVGEETEGLVGDERVNGNLLDSEDTGSLTDVLLYLGSNVGVGRHGVGSPVGGLDQHLHSLLDEFPHVLRTQGSSPLPHRLGLSPDGHHLLAARGGGGAGEPHCRLLQPPHHLQLRQRPAGQTAARSEPQHCWVIWLGELGDNLVFAGKETFKH